MKGFLKRDLYLIMGILRFQMALVVLMAVLALVRPDHADTMLSLLNIYTFLIVMAGVLGLCQSDERNGWMGYACAVPNGRLEQVNARYLLILGLCAGATVLSGGVSFYVGGREALMVTLGFLGVWLLYGAAGLPLSYWLGSRSRVVVLGFVAVGAAFITAGADVFGNGTGALTSQGMLRDGSSPVLLVALGGVALVVSWLLSRRIMANKEF